MQWKYHNSQVLKSVPVFTHPFSEVICNRIRCFCLSPQVCILCWDLWTSGCVCVCVSCVQWSSCFIIYSSTDFSTLRFFHTPENSFIIPKISVCVLLVNYFPIFSGKHWFVSYLYNFTLSLMSYGLIPVTCRPLGLTSFS